MTGDAVMITHYRTDLLINVCTSMLCLVRDSLLQNDFASNMKMLQVSLLIFKRLHTYKYKQTS